MNRKDGLIGKIIKKLDLEKNIILYKSFLALTILQATNFILPLINIPYIIRTIGAEKFGIINIIQALITYFVIFTDYGFNLSATRDVSIHRSDPIKLSQIISNVFTTKLLLCIISALVLGIIVIAIPNFRQEWKLFLFGYGIILGQALLPIWFFQGVENMKFITVLNLLSKIMFTILVFFIVQQRTDYIYILLLHAIGNIISGIIGFLILIKKFKLNFSFSTIAEIKGEISQGWYIFTSNFANIIYTNSNIIILGFFTNNLVVGYYSIAEKVIIAIKQILIVFSQAIYPHMCKLSLEGHKAIIDFLKRFFLPFCAIIFIICCLIFIFAGEIIWFFSGQYLKEPTLILKLFGFLPFIIVLNIPFYQILLAYNLKKAYSSVLTAGAMLNVILNIIMVINFKAIGTVFTVIFTEAFITVGLFLMLELKYTQYSIFTQPLIKPKSLL